MNIIKKIVVLFFILGMINTAYAVPPPDFIIQVVSNLGLYFGIAMAFLSSFFVTFFGYIKAFFSGISKKIIFLFGLIFVGIISFIGAFFYDKYQQEEKISEMKQKIAVMHKKEIESIRKNVETPLIEIENLKETSEEADKEYENYLKESNNDKLNKISFNKEKTLSGNNIKENDSINFIKEYYESINKKDFKKAYEIGNLKVSYNKFVGWYKDIDYLKINSIEKALGTKNGYKIDLVISENGKKTNYIVFKYVGIGEDGKLKFTETKIHKTFTIDDGIKRTKSLPISISNKDFQKVLNSGKGNYIILDAREDLEVKAGYMPGSLHIRFAELKNGEYNRLDKNKIIYVYCWSGIRGKEVALFLRSKGFNAVSLEDGAKGWVKFGGKWSGEISFGNVYKKPEYKKLFMRDTLKEAINNGYVLVDVRNFKKFNKNHLENSINVPLVDLPKSEWDKYINKIPANSKIITVCDEYVNCFYAKVVGIELEKRGFEFKGRYSLVYN